MASVLAIDAAWTAHGSSGMALLQSGHTGWTCVGLAPSYAQFLALAGGKTVDWSASPPGGRPVASDLLGAAKMLLKGADVDVVTIDMPIATTTITGRRAADSAISQAFGGRWCSTHTPSAARPGAISDRLRADFADLGYPVATTRMRQGTTPALVEVYPHPALLALMNAPRRIPYKISRAGRYWPTLSPSDRRRKILRIWRQIHRKLASTIAGADLPFPSANACHELGNARLKRYEDALDALICGWVGIQYLEGRCAPYGDRTSSIWTP
jgi:predicted RNase H-like nuclease